jgi:glycolate oxidase FAD binding subunit
VPKVSSAAFGELEAIGAGAALFRLDGTDAALSEKIVMLRHLLEGGAVVELGCGDAVFRKIASAEIFAGLLRDIWLVRQPLSSQGDYEESEREAAHEDIWVSDWAGARVWKANTPGIDGTKWRELMKPSGGSTQLVRASAETRKRVSPFAPEDGVRAELTKRVKAAFDPLKLFNPGRMWEGV